uniref:ARHGEF1-like PH domain-containing protein n=1 Tax=Eptatretus burgeri TaxID=7764 RepID=A0A8C4NKY0_EPTBU
MCLAACCADVTAVLLNDCLVLLQEKDQRYTLASLDDKSPVISLRKLLVRLMANKDCGIFLIGVGSVPTMYELFATSQDVRSTWINLIRQAVKSLPEDSESMGSETEEDRKMNVTKALQARMSQGRADTTIPDEPSAGEQLKGELGLPPVLAENDQEIPAEEDEEEPGQKVLLQRAIQEVETLQNLVYALLSSGSSSSPTRNNVTEGHKEELMDISTISQETLRSSVSRKSGSSQWPGGSRLQTHKRSEGDLRNLRLSIAEIMQRSTCDVLKILNQIEILTQASTEKPSNTMPALSARTGENVQESEATTTQTENDIASAMAMSSNKAVTIVLPEDDIERVKTDYICLTNDEDGKRKEGNEVQSQESDSDKNLKDLHEILAIRTASSIGFAKLREDESRLLQRWETLGMEWQQIKSLQENLKRGFDKLEQDKEALQAERKCFQEKESTFLAEKNEWISYRDGEALRNMKRNDDTEKMSMEKESDEKIADAESVGGQTECDASKEGGIKKVGKNDDDHGGVEEPQIVTISYYQQLEAICFGDQKGLQGGMEQVHGYLEEADKVPDIFIHEAPEMRVNELSVNYFENPESSVDVVMAGVTEPIRMSDKRDSSNSENELQNDWESNEPTNANFKDNDGEVYEDIGKKNDIRSWTTCALQTSSEEMRQIFQQNESLECDGVGDTSSSFEMQHEDIAYRSQRPAEDCFACVNLGENLAKARASIEHLVISEESMEDLTASMDLTKNVHTARDLAGESATSIGHAVEPATRVGPAAEPATRVGPAAEPATPVGHAVEPATPVGHAVEPDTPVGSAPEPTTPVGPAVEPAMPVGAAAEPATPVGPAVEPDTPVGSAAEPAMPVGAAAEPATPVGPVVEPTTPVGPAAEPAMPGGPAAEPDMPVGPAAEPATLWESIEYDAPVEGLAEDFSTCPGTTQELSACPGPIQGPSHCLSFAQGPSMCLDPAHGPSARPSLVEILTVHPNPTQVPTAHLGPTHEPSAHQGSAQEPSSCPGPTEELSMCLAPSQEPSPCLDPAQESTMCPGPAQESSVCLGPTKEPSMCPGPAKEPSVDPCPAKQPSVGPFAMKEPSVGPGPTEETSVCPGHAQESSVCLGHAQEPSICPGPTQKSSICPGPSQEPSVCPGPTQEPSVCLGPAQEPSVCPGPTQEHSVCPGPAQEPSVCLGPAQESSVCPGPAQESSVCPGSAQHPSVCPGPAQESSVCPCPAQESSVCPALAQEYSVCPGPAQEPSVCPGPAQESSVCSGPAQESSVCSGPAQ